MMFRVCREKLKEAHGNHYQPSEKDMQDFSHMILIFSVVWSLGANINDESREHFNSTFKVKAMQIYNGFPIDNDVYDVNIDFKAKMFKNWSKYVTDFSYDRDQPYFDILVETADTVKFKFLVENLMRQGFNVLVSGDTGVGKSVIVQDFLVKSNEEEFDTGSINFSAQTSSHNLMDVFYSKLKKKRKDLYGPPPPKKMILFIDDVNMPQLDRYGSQPPVEMLRQVID
jgi:dynein heavy chain